MLNSERKEVHKFGATPVHKLSDEKRKIPVMILFFPIGYKNVCISCAAVVAVTAKNDLFAIGAEHGKGIEGFVVTDLALV